MTRILAIVSAAAYLSFSHYCLASAAAAGSARHPHASAAGAAGHGHGSEHEGSGHHGHHDPAPEGGGPSDDSGHCCTHRDAAALATEGPAWGGERRALGTLEAFVAARPLPLGERARRFPREHGPPGLASLVAFGPQPASRPPPPSESR